MTREGKLMVGGIVLGVVFCCCLTGKPGEGTLNWGCVK